MCVVFLVLSSDVRCFATKYLSSMETAREQPGVLLSLLARASGHPRAVVVDTGFD